MTTQNDLVYPDPMRGAEQSYHNQSPEELQTGLTKREYFAAMALQGILANREIQLAMAQDRNFNGIKRDCSIDAEWANEAVKQADFLIEQLNKD